MRVLIILAMAGTFACQIDREKTCSTSGDCRLSGGEIGLCVASPESSSSFCAYRDDACEGGFRFGPLAGDGLAGRCTDGSFPSDAAPPDGAAPDAFPSHELSVSPGGTGRGLVTSDPPGINCGAVCAFGFPEGSTVDLEAVPLMGSRFDGWGGAECTGVAPCAVEMTTPREVDATFARVYSWIRTAGDTGQDEGRAVAFRPGGDVVVVGSFSGTITIGTATLTSDGPNPDIFVAEYTPSGNFRWANRYGGSGTDTATAVTVDAFHNIYVTGSFEGTINFGGDDLPSSGGTDIFLAHLSGADGAHFASMRVGGAGDDAGLGIGVDAARNAVIVGAFGAPVDFGGGSRTAYGNKDAFVAKYNDQLAWVWDRTYGSGGADEARAVVIDGSSGVLVAGQYGGTVDFGAPTMTQSAGATDIFVLHLGSDGSFTWLQRYGGITFEAANSIALDPAGAIVVGGEFSSSVSFGGVDPPLGPNGIVDGFVLKLTSGGSYQWARAISTPGSDFVHGVGATTDHVFAVGRFEQPLDLGVGRHVAAGGEDGFVVKLNAATGAAIWSNAFGGTGDDAALGVAVSSVGSVATTGFYEGSVDFGGGASNSGGMGDYFATQLVP
jgi:hypothetical protein